MEDKATTFGANPEGLAELLGLGVAADDPGAEQPDRAKADLLRARLAGTMPLDVDVVDALPAILGRLCRQLLPLEGRPLGEVLLSPQTDRATIETIKDYGKGLAGRQDGEVEHSVAVVIYFAAIASALLFHDRKISSYSYRALAESFDALVHMPWMAPEIARHLAQARQLCRKKAE